MLAGRRPALAAAVVVVGLAITLHALSIAGVRRVSHDDTISYLAATGHQGAYQRTVDNALDPVAQWVPARRWQRFTRVEQPWPLFTIAQDLGHHDIHPPVYFWLLHAWALLVGVHLWTGPALNLVLHALTAVVLWRLARRVLGAALPAWAVTGVWATLPAVVQTANSSRQYSLAALWAVLLVSSFLRARDGATLRVLLAMVAWTALGMLTLFTFGLLVAGLGVVCVADLASPERRSSAVRRLAAFTVAGMVFIAAQPWLPEVLARQRAQAEPFSIAQMLERARVLVTELPRFAIANVPVLPGMVLLAATIAIAVLAWRERPAARPIVWLAVWVPGVTAVAYLAAVSPSAAYRAQYFSIAMPWVAFLPVLAWPHLRPPPVRTTVAAVVAIAALVNVTAFARLAAAPPATILEGPQPAVLDNLARGVLLRILWDAPPSLPVFAADQATLLATTDRWLRCDTQLPCHARPVVLTTQVQYEATADGQRELLAAAGRVRRVSPAPDIGDIAERYKLSAPVAVAERTLGGPEGDSHAGARSRTASTMTHTNTAARTPAAVASTGYGVDGDTPRRHPRYQNSAQ